MTRKIPCSGIRQPTHKRRVGGKLTGYEGRYGLGLCSKCQRLVACYKDGSAVYHLTVPEHATNVT